MNTCLTLKGGKGTTGLYIASQPDALYFTVNIIKDHNNIIFLSQHNMTVSLNIFMWEEESLESNSLHNVQEI